MDASERTRLLALADEIERLDREATAGPWVEFLKETVTARAEVERLTRDKERAFDCHAGPGTTEPACNACVTCLTRDLEAAQADVVRLTRERDALFDRLEMAQLSAEQWQKAAEERQRERIAACPKLRAENARLRSVIRAAPHDLHCDEDGLGPDGKERPCDCWKAGADK